MAGEVSGEIGVQSSVFNLKTAISSTDAVFVVDKTTVATSTVSKSGKASKTTTKTIPAIKIGEKLLVIKGFSEDTTQPIEMENADLSLTEIAPIEALITPTQIDVVVTEQEGAATLEEDGDISEYEVVSGDTVESIAQKFSISAETVLWANDLKKQTPLRVGQKLVILPVSGVSYKIRSGDTVSEIAEKFAVTQQELTEFNNLVDGKLSVGDVIIIPGGKIVPVKVSVPVKIGSGKTDPKKTVNTTASNAFSRPAAGVRTQGIHGHNGIDIASSYGTPITAAGAGTVTLVRGGDGWNGGYGNYVVITHQKGVQTLYAHMSSISVSQGQSVSKGQQVGAMGSTGQSTGVHLHFEVRGARNPF